MSYLTVEQDLYVTTCPTCRVVHGIPRAMEERMRARGGSAYCPNGHSWHFTKTQVEELEKQLARERAAHDQTRASRDYAQADRDRERRRSAAARGQVTKIKKRVGNGVCPCCGRTFQNLQRHMATKHPQWHEEGRDG